MTLEGRAAARVLIPVEFGAGGPAHQQIAALPRGNEIAVAIDDLRFVARYRLPQGTGPNAIGPIGNEYVQHLRRTDAVHDVQTGARAPSPRDVLRQRFTRRIAQPQR